MLETRRQLADRGRALTDRTRESSPLAFLGEPGVDREPPRRLSERLADRVRMHRPTTPLDERVGARVYWLRTSAAEMASAVRNPKWLLRLACAAAALGLTLAVIAISRTPAHHPGRGAGSATGAATTGLPGSLTGTGGVPSLAQASATGGNPPATHGKTATRHTRSSGHVAGTGRGYSAYRAPSHRAAATHPTRTARSHAAPRSTTTSSQPSSTGTTPTTTSTTPTTTIKSSSSSSSASSSSSSAAPTGGVLSPASFAALRLGDARLSRLTERFGSTATPAQLGSVFGANWASILAPHQPVGDTCVYYLTSPSGASSVYQLCFDGSGRLAEKTAIGR